jgi:hypothetical protein
MLEKPSMSKILESLEDVCPRQHMQAEASLYSDNAFGHLKFIQVSKISMSD